MATLAERTSQLIMRELAHPEEWALVAMHKTERGTAVVLRRMVAGGELDIDVTFEETECRLPDAEPPEGGKR